MTFLSPLSMALSALSDDLPRGVIELPEAHAVRWMALTKGAHKYVKRVPTGKTTKTGKPRYRYFYDVGHGGGVHAPEHMVEGAAFRHGDGHFHITKVDGDKLHVRHSQTGAEHVTTKRDLAGKLEAEHGAALKAYRERAVKALAEAKESGASKKQIARLEERVKAASSGDLRSEIGQIIKDRFTIPEVRDDDVKPERTIGGRKASEARVRSATREEFIASEGAKLRAQQEAAMASVESDIADAYPGPHPHGLTPVHALFLDKNPTAESKKLSARWLSANKALKSDIDAALSTAGHAWDQANRPRNKDARDDIHFKGRSVL